VIATRRKAAHVPRRRMPVLLALVVITTASLHLVAQTAPVPQQPSSLKFAVLGDMGTGEPAQYEVGRRLWAARPTFPYDMVLLLGDNLYGRQEPRDFVLKFERPYEPLIAAGVRFYAALGNHDKPSNVSYPPFNMAGERYYTFARDDVRFLVLDTNLLDPKQLAWAEATLSAARESWRIAVFHHPIYSDGGRHGSNIELRVALEPLLVRHNVSVAFSGHEHIYERIKPQKGITYFVAGSSGQLRKGDLNPSELMAKGFDQDQAFMLVEIAGSQLSFQTISRTGEIVDAGAVPRRPGT
jgi:3',5'-cyclic AMP phosphodiesterase CpdA